MYQIEIAPGPDGRKRSVVAYKVKVKGMPQMDSGDLEVTPFLEKVWTQVEGALGSKIFMHRGCIYAIVSPRDNGADFPPNAMEFPELLLEKLSMSNSARATSLVFNYIVSSVLYMSDYKKLGKASYYKQVGNVHF